MVEARALILCACCVWCVCMSTSLRAISMRASTTRRSRAPHYEKHSQCRRVSHSIHQSILINPYPHSIIHESIHHSGHASHDTGTSHQTSVEPHTNRPRLIFHPLSCVHVLGVSGVLVTEVFPPVCEGLFKLNDVVLSLDGHAIGDDATIKFRRSVKDTHHPSPSDY